MGGAGLKTHYIIPSTYTFVMPTGVDSGSGLNMVSTLSLEEDEEELIPAPEGAEEDFKNDFLSHAPQLLRTLVSGESGESEEWFK